MKLRPMRLEDAARVTPIPIQHPQLFLAGPAFTLTEDDDTPVGCAGLVILWPGSAEAWMLVEPALAWRYRIRIIRAIQDQLPALIAHFKLHRIQAVAAVDHPAAQRMLRRFGFEEEGLMRRYDLLGRDCIRYALLPKDEP